VRIQDPIHGTIAVSDRELEVVDSPYYQRLRNIRQLGFGEMAFPGATHTRHAHSLGAMHVSGKLFGVVASRGKLPPEVADRFAQAVRIAVLCHDLGHMPLRPRLGADCAAARGAQPSGLVATVGRPGFRRGPRPAPRGRRRYPRRGKRAHPWVARPRPRRRTSISRRGF